MLRNSVRAVFVGVLFTVNAFTAIGTRLNDMDNKIEDGVVPSSWLTTIMESQQGTQNPCREQKEYPKSYLVPLYAVLPSPVALESLFFGGTQVFWSRCLWLSSCAVVSCGARPDPTCWSRDTTFARGSKGNSREELEASRCSTSPCLNSVANSAHLATNHSVILRLRHFYLGFRFLLIHATGSSVLMIPRTYFHFLLLEFPCLSQFPAMKM